MATKSNKKKRGQRGVEATLTPSGDAACKEESQIVPRASSMKQLKLCHGSGQAQRGLPEQQTDAALSGQKVHRHLEHHFEDTASGTE